MLILKFINKYLETGKLSSGAHVSMSSHVLGMQYTCYNSNLNSPSSFPLDLLQS